MKVSKDAFPNFQVRHVTFAGFFAVELLPTELATKGKEVMAATWESVSSAVKTRPEPGRLDEDGDWSITWESGRRQFSIDLQKRVVGATFRHWAEPKAAADLAKAHAATAFEKLGIHRLSSLAIRFDTVFLLPQGKTNHKEILPRLLGSGESESALKSLITDRDKIGRFDVNFSYRLDDYHYAYIKVELPTNRDKRTAWFELGVKTRDDLTVAIQAPGTDDRDGLGDFMEAANGFYRDGYASFVSSVLGGLDVDFLERADD